MSKRIFLSPSNQTDNAYSYGNTTEAVQCGKIAEAAKNALERCGFEVKIDHMSSTREKSSNSDSWNADLHIPIHTNAANGSVAGTRLFCYDTAGEGYKVCKAIMESLSPITPGKSDNITADPELNEIRLPNAVSAYIEVEFHDVPDVAKWIIENTVAIGEKICQGICKYYGVAYKSTAVQPAPVLPAENKYPQIQFGDTGEVVKDAQRKINRIKLYQGMTYSDLTVDGDFGKHTQECVMAVQRRNNLEADGIIGEKTWAVLNSKYKLPQSVVQFNSQGYDVATLQYCLNIAKDKYNLSYDKLNVDADFGKATENALIEFQRYCKIEADGIAGAKTLECLRRVIE